ncbi:15052_t:CDS:2, partial [Gigaspora rosea]
SGLSFVLSFGLVDGNMLLSEIRPRDGYCNLDNRVDGVRVVGACYPMYVRFVISCTTYADSVRVFAWFRKSVVVALLSMEAVRAVARDCVVEFACVDGLEYLKYFLKVNNVKVGCWVVSCLKSGLYWDANNFGVER